MASSGGRLDRKSNRAGGADKALTWSPGLGGNLLRPQPPHTVILGCTARAGVPAAGGPPASLGVFFCVVSQPFSDLYRGEVGRKR